MKSLGCTALGLVLSYLPEYKPKKVNLSIPIVVVLLLALFYLAYGEKSYNVCVIMIIMFCALVYFSMAISVKGVAFDHLGKLSSRIYLYMAFITVIYYLGITNNTALFFIDLFVALLDLAITIYRAKYRHLKASAEKAKVDEEKK